MSADKTYFVETRATVLRVYEVRAASPMDAICASTMSTVLSETDEFEETLSVTEGDPTHD